MVVVDLKGLSKPNDSVFPLKNMALPIHTCVTMSKTDVALLLHSPLANPTLGLQQRPQKHMSMHSHSVLDIGREIKRKTITLTTQLAWDLWV